MRRVNSWIGDVFNLGMQSFATSTSWGIEVDDYEFILSMQQWVDQLVCWFDLRHIWWGVLLPPPKSSSSTHWSVLTLHFEQQHQDSWQIMFGSQMRSLHQKVSPRERYHREVSKNSTERNKREIVTWIGEIGWLWGLHSCESLGSFSRDRLPLMSFFQDKTSKPGTSVSFLSNPVSWTQRKDRPLLRGTAVGTRKLWRIEMNGIREDACCSYCRSLYLVVIFGQCLFPYTVLSSEHRGWQTIFGS